MHLTLQIETLPPALWYLREDKQLTDIILDVVAEGPGDHNQKEFHAHKVVLSAGSGYFQKLFTGSFLESTAPKIKLSTNPLSFEYVLSFIYGVSNDFSQDADLNIQIALDLIYFEVRGFDIENYIGYYEITDNESFHKYLKLISHVYPENIPVKIINGIASNIKKDTDLNEYDDSFITTVLSSPSYAPKNISDAYNLIKDLVDKGHTPELYALINYDLMPPGFRSQFNNEFLETYNRKGPIPALSDLVQDINKHWVNKKLLIIDLSRSQQKENRVSFVRYTMTVFDASGHLWIANVSLSENSNPQIGDILKTHITAIDSKNRKIEN